MSDLAATNCGCGCDNNGGSCGCNCGCGCGGFCAAAEVAVALAADKHPPISSLSFENASMYILIPQI